MKEIFTARKSPCATLQVGPVISNIIAYNFKAMQMPRRSVHFNKDEQAAKAVALMLCNQNALVPKSMSATVWNAQIIQFNKGWYMLTKKLWFYSSISLEAVISIHKSQDQHHQIIQTAIMLMSKNWQQHQHSSRCWYLLQI